MPAAGIRTTRLGPAREAFSGEVVFRFAAENASILNGA
jgi:hypothetical protein